MRSWPTRLATAGRAATGRTGTLPVLSGLRLELVGDQLTVTGTDLDLTIQLELTVGGDADGGVVLPARLAADIVRSLSAGKVEVTVDGDDVSITGGRSQFSVRPLSLDDYPRLPTPASSAVTLPPPTFGEALRQVVRAASTDEARPILTGVLLTAEDDGLRLVATDSYRLAVRDLPGRQRARRRPEGARARRGRSTSCSDCSAPAASSRCASASATRRSRSAARGSRLG